LTQTSGEVGVDDARRKVSAQVSVWLKSNPITVIDWFKGDPPMAISADLGPVLEKFVDTLVEKGRYGSKSEVIREGIRLVQERESRLAALDAAIELGLDDIRNGRTTPAEEVFDRLEAKYAAMARKNVA
jgi:antitoxin ParD1/3/4